MSNSIQTSLNSVMKDKPDKYHAWGVPKILPRRSNSQYLKRALFHNSMYFQRHAMKISHFRIATRQTDHASGATGFNS